MNLLQYKERFCKLLFSRVDYAVRIKIAVLFLQDELSLDKVCHHGTKLFCCQIRIDIYSLRFQISDFFFLFIYFQIIIAKYVYYVTFRGCPLIRYWISLVWVPALNR